MVIKENISLAKHTTFKVGGSARYFCIVKSKQDLIKAIKKAKEEKIPFFVLGGGSNVLALDKGYNGLVIKFESTKLEDLVKSSVKKSLTGLEWAAGIPGTIGGAVYGNAQAFDTKMSDIVKSVEVFNTKTLKIKKLLKKQCQFSAKKSIFKKNKNLIILSVILNLKQGDKKEIQKMVKEHLDYRKKNHPLDFPSVGSVFINKTGGLPSSYLIEKAGLKGIGVGGVKVSEKHAGFIVNTGKAKAKDVLDLIKIIKQKVKSKFGITLKEEVQIIK